MVLLLWYTYDTTPTPEALGKVLMFNKPVSYTLVAWQGSSFSDGLDGKSRTGFTVLMCGVDNSIETFVNLRVGKM